MNYMPKFIKGLLQGLSSPIHIYGGFSRNCFIPAPKLVPLYKHLSINEAFHKDMININQDFGISFDKVKNEAHKAG